jgi:Cytidylate kinase
MEVVSLDVIVAEIMQAPHVGATRIVAVDGRAGSGKSSLAHRLAERTGATVVHTDDFAAWDDLAGWWPRFDADVLMPLLDGRDAHFQVRDWEGDELGRSLGPWKTAPWTPVVVIEGVTVARREATGRLAYRAWVEAALEVRLRRGLGRDGESHRELWLDWQRQEDEFFTVDQPDRRADLIVHTDTDLPHDPAREVVRQVGVPSRASAPR